MFKFWIKFYWNVFLGLKWQQVSIGSGNGLAAYRRQAIIWTKFEQGVLSRNEWTAVSSIFQEHKKFPCSEC